MSHDYSPPLGEFQPADADEDIDAKWDAWFEQQEKNGYAVLSHEEWREKLNEAATDAYGEGRKDEREAILEILARAGFELRELPTGTEVLCAVHQEAKL